MQENNTMDILARTKFVQALRDFFLAKNNKELHTSLEALLFYEQNKDIKSDKDRLLKLEYAFNRLFIGPDKVLAPPFASIYLDREPILKGKAAQEIEKLLIDMGLDFENDSNLPLDHISIELELWLVISNVIENLQYKLETLAVKSQEYADTAELLKDVEEKLTWLNTAHMPLWIYKFIQRIHNAPDELEKLGEKAIKEDILLEEILYVVACLEAWLKAYTYKK